MKTEMAFGNALGEALEQFGLDLSLERRGLLARHFDLLLQANRSVNLTAVVDPREAAAKHYCDSLSLLGILDSFAEPGHAVDVGSGAGFPGMALAIARPDWRFTLIEAKQKKCRFLDETACAIGLKNVEVSGQRSETLCAQAPHRERYDLAVGRAIAGLATLIEMLLPLTRVGGVAVAMKTNAPSLDDRGRGALREVGGGEIERRPYELPWNMGRRVLLVIPKIAPTRPGFPRRPGIAAKRPLF